MNRFASVLFTVVLGFYLTANAADPPLKALIVDGQNNHEMWPKTSFMMKAYLEQTGLFSVDILRTRLTWRGEKYLKQFALPGITTTSLPASKTDTDFRPDFSRYDVVINNFGWKCAPWPEETKRAFVRYVRSGGGLVVVHAADNCWPDWPEYNQMIGLGGWGGRDQSSGPYVFYDSQGLLSRETSSGSAGGHGAQEEFLVVARDHDHPILHGLSVEWMHSKDELYNHLRGPADNMAVLATAFSSPDNHGTGRHEPVLMAVDFGAGRVFHTTLGHADYSMECVGFITTFQRGAEWAATGQVTQKAPPDFPGIEKPSTRGFDHEN